MICLYVFSGQVASLPCILETGQSQTGPFCWESNYFSVFCSHLSFLEGELLADLSEANIMASHGKLKRSLAVEVILELRFQDSFKLSNYIEKLTKSVRVAFPGRQATNVVGLQFEMNSRTNSPSVRSISGSNAMPDIPQYRFDGFDGYIFQIGEGMLSFHSTNYQGFDDFIEKAFDLIKKHKSTSGVKSYTAAKLRYLNLIPTGDQGIDPSEFITWGLSTPVFPNNNVVAVANNQQIFIQFADGDSQRINLSVPQVINNRTGLVIDIDNTVSARKLEMGDLNEIKHWASQAHEHIWDTFHRTLQPNFLKELQDDSIPNESF